MLWKVSILVKFLWYPGCFLYMNGQIFLQIWGIICYYFIKYIVFPFVLHPFSSMPMILRFGLLMESLNSCIFLS
jgi:hypothetical protein